MSAPSSGQVVELPLTGETPIHRLALTIGLLTFLIPTSILLLLCIQMREGQTRRLRASRLVYRDKYNPERRRMLAMRAVVSLPADHLLKLSPDPIGDLVRGEHDALVAAMLSEAGLAPAALPAD